MGIREMNENTTLLNGYCHLVNRTVLFIEKYFEGIVPAGHLDQEIYWKTKRLYAQVEELIARGEREQAEELLAEYLQFANAYFEQGNPWKTRKEDRKACRNTILNSVQLIANLTVLLTPVIDYPTDQVSGWFSLDDRWTVHSVRSGYELPKAEPIALFALNEQCIV